jgi:hypothetical protein
MPIRTLSGPICAALLLAACGTDRGTPLDIDGDAAADLEIPVGADLLQPWLAERAYADFAGESEIHESSGPHGRVRTFLSPGLAASLDAGADVHPRGVAAIKELYEGDAPNGWAVSVKIEEDSAGGAGWYWYEVFDPSPDAAPFVNGTGADGCTGCHDAGIDFVRAPFPLQ